MTLLYTYFMEYYYNKLYLLGVVHRGINITQQANEYALTYFEDYLTILHQHKKLETQHQELQARHDQLQNELIKLHSRKSPQLPFFLSRTRK